MLGPEVVTVRVGETLLTVWVSVATEVPFLESPLYVATMGSLPAGRVEVLTDAVPFVTVVVPSTVEPLVNVTVPVTIVGRVSVKVTGLPLVEGFCEEVSVEAGLIIPTLWMVDPEAGLLLVSPL